MSRRIITRVLAFVFLIIVDVLVYIALGIALMRYGDNYDDSKGEYWSWKSMAAFDKTISVLMTGWNIVNLVLIGFVVYSIYKKLKLSSRSNTNGMLQ